MTQRKTKAVELVKKKKKLSQRRKPKMVAGYLLAPYRHGPNPFTMS